MKAFTRQSLCENTRKLRDYRNITKTETSTSDLLMYAVNIIVDIPTASMKDKICDHVKSRLIVTKNQWRKL